MKTIAKTIVALGGTTAAGLFSTGSASAQGVVYGGYPVYVAPSPQVVYVPPPSPPVYVEYGYGYAPQVVVPPPVVVAPPVQVVRPVRGYAF